MMAFVVCEEEEKEPVIMPKSILLRSLRKILWYWRNTSITEEDEDEDDEVDEYPAGAVNEEESERGGVDVGVNDVELSK